MNKTLKGCLGELKNKGKVLSCNPKSGSGHLRKLSLVRAFDYNVFKVTVPMGFHKGGRNLSRSLMRVVARTALSTVFPCYTVPVLKEKKSICSACQRISSGTIRA